MNPFTLVTKFQFSEGGRSKLAEFQRLAQKAFERHGLVIESEFEPLAPGCDLVQVASFPSPERFQAYLADEEVVRAAPIRAQGLTAMTGSLGPEMVKLGVEQVAGPVQAVAQTAPGLGADEFLALYQGEQAQSLFQGHGVTLHRLCRVVKSVVVCGPTPANEPTALAWMSAATASQLDALMGDLVAQGLAPGSWLRGN